MALSAPGTPRSMYVTPKRLTKQSTQTPECYRKVSVETPSSFTPSAITPSSNRKRSSRDKYDKISNLNVAVRVRPMNQRELNTVGAFNVVSVEDQELTVHVTSGSSVTDHTFQYDHVFWSCDEESENHSSQHDVFIAMGQPLLDYAFRGYNACLFAYGQTGSGKSYSMMGQTFGNNIDIDQNGGIIPQFCQNLFDRIGSLTNSTASVEVSYFEIYNEKIHNLLATSPGSNRQPLKVREHPVWGPYVVDLSVHTVQNYKELRNYLLLGNKNRATAATAMNDNSSRSHSIFTIEISVSENDCQGDSFRSKISLVDLAGSERLSYTSNNDERMRQGVCINKSLLTLGKVISALADQKKGQFVPYRDSVLTWLLRESLGGNSLTSMLATITPASCNIDETLATLRYACQARSIVNRACVNENPNDKLIRELRAEVGRLRALRQDFERSSFGPLSGINSSAEYEQELDGLRQKLSEKEEQLLDAQFAWEQRFMETKEKQLRELAEAEKKKEELESRVRVLRKCDMDVTLSPYRSDFLEELEGMLTTSENKKPQTLTKAIVTESMNQIYVSLAKLRPIVDSISDENIALNFAKANKALQAFETALNNNVKQNEKCVKFRL